MKAGIRARVLALFLSLVMMFSVAGVPYASAAAVESGMCEHHPVHTAECGYQAPSPGAPCTHVHDGTCGYAAPSPGTACTMGCTDTDGDGAIEHAEGCGYTPHRGFPLPART